MVLLEDEICECCVLAVLRMSVPCVCVCVCVCVWVYVCVTYFTLTALVGYRCINAVHPHTRTPPLPHTQTHTHTHRCIVTRSSIVIDPAGRFPFPLSLSLPHPEALLNSLERVSFPSFSSKLKRNREAKLIRSQLIPKVPSSILFVKQAGIKQRFHLIITPWYITLL